MKMKLLILIITSLVFIDGMSFSSNVYSKDISIDNNSLYSTDSLRIKANQAAGNKEYKKAAFLFQQLVKKLPNDEELRLKLAFVLLMNKDYKAAAGQFEKIKKTSKNSKYINYAKKQLNVIASLEKSKVKEINPVAEAGEDKIKLVEIDEPGKDNYLCNKDSSTIFEDGSFRRWEKEDLPVKVYIPPIPESFAVKDPEKYINIVKYSMQKWSEKAPKFISFKFVANSSEANININWIETFKDESTWGLASMPNYIKAMKKRVSTINLAVKAQAGSAAFTNEPVFFSDDELSGLIIHETGHSLGLAHSYKDRNNIDIMAPNYHISFPGVKPEITERDINTLKLLYSFPEGAKCTCKAEKTVTEKK